MARTLLFLLFALASAQSAEVTIRLIGTGGPELTPDRAGAATLITVNGQQLLFDVGRNGLHGIYAAGVPPQDVTRIFLTHLHSDHIVGLPDLWITPWFLLGRKTGLTVTGPAGTAAMIAGMRQMYAHDLERRVTPILKREYLDIEVHEISGGAVDSSPDVRVTAIPVEHRDGNPALGYRVDAAGYSILMTGDATLTDSLYAEGKGVDVLISNVAAGSSAIEKSGAIQPILAKLMLPEQAAHLFSATKPRLAVFSHIVKKGLPGSAGDAVILARTRRAGYSGPLIMGVDGMKITLGPTIRVTRPQPAKTLRDLDGIPIHALPEHN